MEGPAVPDALAVLGCVLGWLAWSVLIGYLASRLPLAALEQDTWLTRQRPWAETTAGYRRRLQIHRWKSLLPDAGDTFPGGVRKNSLVRRDPAALQRLVAETRRAELVHLALWPFWIVTALWLPRQGVLINLIFATAFNLPCLWLQRFNRLRLLGSLEAARQRVRPTAGEAGEGGGG
jgi:glycosyl-4,4'-diaponeurosporenoate acyltransferase